MLYFEKGFLSQVKDNRMGIDVLKSLFSRHFHQEVAQVETLPQAGSDRVYYRLSSESFSAIGATNYDKKENEIFIYLARHFKSNGVNVPEIYEISDDGLIYLQEDLGGLALYDLVKGKPFTEEVESLYKKTLSALVKLQIDGAKNFDFEICYPVQVFDRTSMFWDLNSFKYYFVRPLRVFFHEPSLQRDFHALTKWLLEEKHQYFMMRDCQSRNVMIKNGEPFFIDFQGGRKGALQYDAASLLWQAGAQIPMENRAQLLEFYIEKVQEKIPDLNIEAFRNRYYGFLLIRMLQVLSAYGFRGLFEGRSHFIESIPPALKNVDWFMKNVNLPIELSEIYKVLTALIHHEKFQEQAWQTAPKKLKIAVNSFSFKRGIPKDKSGNGGGFVFDCRGLHNPGRYEPYKQLTGKDTEVINFLKTQSKIDEFLESVYKVIDINIQNYLERGFENLQINFGCTGGQHRSVYCAEATCQYIRDKYGVEIEIHHIEQELKGNFI
ncbi:MAG: phosphotransferase [Chitinophagales bacterium]|nr:phosphotransferase [Chitinophagales bacterium]